MSEKYTYLVPAKTVSVKHEIKKSIFIATAGRAVGMREAKSFIDGVCRKYPDATHNCYAFIAGDPGGTTEMGLSDDGEVPGTAAKPMMNVLEHKKIGEIVVVVTRYYGGTNLGTGGLVRAYSESVQLALEKLPLEKRVELLGGKLGFPYNYEGGIRHIFEQNGVRIDNTVYRENVTMEIRVPKHAAGAVNSSIADLTSGNINIEWNIKPDSTE